MNLERKSKYKHGIDFAEESKEKRRQESNALRKCKRMVLINSKRLRVYNSLDNSYENTASDEIQYDQIVKAAKSLMSRKGRNKDTLYFLRQGFALGTHLIDAFFDVDNSLQGLVGILTCNDSELQLEAAWCLVNISAGSHNHCVILINQVSSYLITYLQCNNPIMQDLCAWTLANIAGDCVECLEALITRGTVPILISLLDSTCSDVVRSTSFALCNMMQGDKSVTQLLVDYSLITKAMKVWHYKAIDIEVNIEVSWIFAYICAVGEYEKCLTDIGFLVKLSDFFCCLSQNDSGNYLILTPLLRCLGNICGDSDMIIQELCKNKGLLPALNVFLNSEQSHIRKETLWALSNMTSVADVSFFVISHDDMLQSIIKHLSHTYDFKLEALFCICNISSHGLIYCKTLFECDIFTPMIQMMNTKDLELSKLSLQFFYVGFRFMFNNNILKQFEEAGGMNLLELFEYHENDDIQHITQYIFDKYIHQDDESI